MEYIDYCSLCKYTYTKDCKYGNKECNQERARIMLEVSKAIKQKKGLKMVDTLKPCPFCGNMPIFKAKSNSSRDTRKGCEFTIFCQGCGIELPKTYSFEIEFDLANPYGIKVVADEREEAVETWNRRTENDH